MDTQPFIGNNRPEDVSWLCSLSESELDMLLSLKKLASQRAKIVGHEALAQKLDLRMLRALGFILMQHVKGQLKKDLSDTSSSGSEALLDGCNLLNCDLQLNVNGVNPEALMTDKWPDTRKRMMAQLSGETSNLKRQKTGNEL